jgi:hypothetical protein
LLRQADLDLAAAYRAARAASKDRAHRAILKNDEHQWILRRNNECAITKYTVVTDGNRPGFVDCLLDQYEERINDLQQMKLHPKVDPAAISSPIRRSFLAASKTEALPTDISLSTFQIPAGGAAPALAWLPDGTLVVLAIAPAGDAAIYAWRAGNVRGLAKLPAAVGATGLCTLPDGTIAVLDAKTTAIRIVSPSGQVSESAPSDSLGCGAGGGAEITATGPNDTTLDLGPLQTGITPNPRFVTLATPSAVTQVMPPIRIDSRYHLAAGYAPFLDAFVVSSAVKSEVLDYASVRRWSKTDCLAYWTVSSKTAAASRGCIPFGPYEAAVPLPLPTKNAVYFAAAGFGLYRVAAGGAQPVLSGNFGQPTVSPDGCSIALAVQGGSGAAAQGAALVQLGGSGVVTVLSVCRPPASGVPGSSQAAP